MKKKLDPKCKTCDDGRKLPENDNDRTIIIEDGDAIVICRNCGRCLQA